MKNQAWCNSIIKKNNNFEHQSGKKKKEVRYAPYQFMKKGILREILDTWWEGRNKN